MNIFSVDSPVLYKKLTIRIKSYSEVLNFLIGIQIMLFGSMNTVAQNLKKADQIIYNAKIISGPYTPTYKVMVIHEHKIIALFKDDSWKKQYSSEVLVDMKNKTILPGFIDGHCHFLGLGKAMNEVNLYGCKSWEETVERVVDYSKKHPNKLWIHGRGWDQNAWPVKEFPNNRLLDSLLPGKSVVLSRVDGHAVIANTKALKYAGITAATLVKGGKVGLNDGNLSGILVDNAIQFLESKIPEATQAQKIKSLLTAQTECLKYGITQVSEAGLSMRDMLLIDSLSEAGALKMRFYMMGQPGEETWNYISKNGPINHKGAKFKSIKIYADGALGSRGALLKKPYCDEKSSYGLQLIDTLTLDSILKHIYDIDFQACTHAIGDSANALVLKAYSKLLQTTTNERRWRIEHAQVVDPKDLHYFSTYSIIASVQPTHATSDMYWAEERLCEHRMNGAYSYKSLLAHSGIMPLGTDFPVEAVSPFYTIRASRFRQDGMGFPKKGFMKNEGLSSTETFAGMTIWAAKGNFWEEETGTLEVGKFADFIVLDVNPYTASIKKLKKLNVLQTYIAGVKVF